MMMSEIAYEAAPAADIATARTIHRVWPLAVIAFGLGLTAAWVCLLGYGMVEIIRFAF
jgi:hypothetical protein